MGHPTQDFGCLQCGLIVHTAVRRWLSIGDLTMPGTDTDSWKTPVFTLLMVESHD